MNVGRGSRTGIVRFENESSRAKGAKEREWRNEEDRGWKRERERERERQTGLKGEGRSFEDGDMELVRDERGSETGHSCFIGPLRLPPRRWREEGGRRWNRLYTRRRRKTRMRLMIYMGATVYYRLDPICGYLVSFSRFFALPPPYSFSTSVPLDPIRFLFGSSALLSILTSEQRIRVYILPVALLSTCLGIYC